MWHLRLKDVLLSLLWPLVVLADTLRAVSSTNRTQIPKKVDGRMAAVVAQFVKQCMQKEKDVVSALTVVVGLVGQVVFAQFNLPFPYYFCMSIKEHLISSMLSMVSFSVGFMWLFLFVCVLAAVLGKILYKKFDGHDK